MQITSSSLTYTVQKFIAARSGFAASAQATPNQNATSKPAVGPQSSLASPFKAGLDEVETEYSDRGSFGGAAKAAEMPALMSLPASQTHIRTTTADDPYMKAGVANHDELYEEYLRFKGSVVEAHAAGTTSTAVRHFIPAGETKESVMRMDEQDYVWAVEDGMNDALRRDPRWQAMDRLSQQEMTQADTSKMVSDALSTLQKFLPALNESVFLNSAEYAEKAQGTASREEAFQARMAQNASKLKAQLRYVNNLVAGIAGGPNTVEGNILVRDEQGRYQLGAFSVSFKGQPLVSWRDAFQEFRA